MLTRIVRPAPALVRSTTRCFSLEFHKVNDDYLVDPLDETARSALAKSCYVNINWKISENARVFDAIARMAANKIGALAVTSGDTETGDVIGVISERDYLNKVGLLGRKSKETQVKEICTMGKANLVSVTLDNPIDKCMKKMIDHNVRHLLVRQKDTGNMVGMISVKDIVKCTIAKHDAQLNKLHSHLVEATVMKGL